MKLFASLTLLIVLCLPILAPAQATAPVTGEAKIVLAAPSVIRIGEMARLDVTASTATSVKWLLIPSTSDIEVYESGHKAVFSARKAGDYRFVIACAKGDTVDVITHVIKVLTPPLKPTTNSLSEWIPFWNWDSPMPPKECKALADSFEDIASQVEDLDDAKEWIKVTAKANRRVLGDRLDAWAPFLDRIGELLLKKAKSGALMTPEDHQKAWLEVAAGLRKCA